MAREKRTKPCGNCKKSKVKCEYTDSLPCVRCVNGGLAASCSFVVKLPSLSLSPFEHHVGPQYAPGSGSHAPLGPMYESARPQAKQLLPLPTKPPLQPAPAEAIPAMTRPSPDPEWKASMESKLSSVDSKFNYILNALTANQQALMEEREAHRKVLTQNQALQKDIDSISRSIALPGTAGGDAAESPRKRARVGPASDDFRDSVITLEQAKDMFRFFDAHIAQQLFGFEIKSFSVEAIWASSPILICAICTIASMHHPEAAISGKQGELRAHLHRLCSGVLFQHRPRTEAEGFNTIVALVLCSFWLADSAMFTGLALQLAKDFGLNQSRPRKKSTLRDKDRLKLWYLLFILDGQQSMTSSRESFLVPSNDYTLQHSRQLLLEDGEAAGGAGAGAGAPPRPSFTDLRLVSQVEYNVALTESLKGHAWDLLAPAAFGIPSKSNLELDKWMVSWTVLLAPMNNGAVWSSKSTLIYYNFAKMHINSSLIRQLQSSDSQILPDWQNYTAVEARREPAPAAEPYDSDDSDDDADDPAAAAAHCQVASYNVAVGAAHTVLGLVLSDPDISANLRYVPVHIHLMLYYAAILVVSAGPPAEFASAQDAAQHFAAVAGRLQLVKRLQRTIAHNLPTDRGFGTRLLANLEALFDERIARLRRELDASPLDAAARADLLCDVARAPAPDDRRERISAWPGSHHGHP